jgi:deoxyribonuclease-4
VAERVLTLRELNRTTLLRQLLLRRERLPPVRAVERLAGLQTQRPSSPYLALWSRLEGFERGSLERSLLRRRIVKALLMRATMHLVSARDYPYLDAAVREARTLTRVRGTERPPDELVERIVALTRERPRTRTEIMKALGFHSRTLEVDKLRTYAWVMALGRLEQTPDSAVFGFRGSPAYEPAAHEHPPTAEAVAHAIRRYLAAFGPATRADVSHWSGVPIRDLEPGFDELHLRSFRDESGRELLDLPRAPLAEARVEAPPRLLPRWDELLLAHKDRTRVLPEEHRKAVIRKNGDVQQAFLVDGFVAGLWWQQDERIVLEPFAPLPRLANGSSRTRRHAWLPGSASVRRVLLGGHCSGGIKKALDNAAEFGMDAVQLFAQSPRTWRFPQHDPADLEAFRRRREELGIDAASIHAVYLLNLASPKKDFYEKSTATLCSTVDTACAIGAETVVFHVGSHQGAGFEASLERVVPALAHALERCDETTWLCMENAAGTGDTIGRSLEELAALYEAAGRHPRLGVCLDSCHLYASGYDVTDPAELDRVVEQLDETIGLDRLRCLHVNDSKTPLGSNRDRHDNIGDGLMGEKLGVFLAHPKFQELPAYLEVPGTDGHGPDLEQMTKLRKLYARATKRESRRTRAKASRATPTSGRAGSARASVGKRPAKRSK